jgi:hypothetical protein
MDKISELPEASEQQMQGQGIKEHLLKYAQTTSPRALHLVKRILNYLSKEAGQ